MNNDNFNNFGQPQNNVNPGMPGMQPQNDMNPGMPGMQPQNNVNPGMPGVQPQNNMNPGMPGMQPQNNMNPGMPGMQPQYNMNPNMAQPTVKKPMNLPLVIGIGAVVVIALVVIILLVTGVIGGKKLTCTMEDSYMGMTSTEELIISFKDDKPSKIMTKQTIDYGTNTYYKEMIKESFDEELEYSKEQGYDAKITSNDTSYTLTVTIGKDDIPSTIDGEETTYENIKAYYEDLDYTCE